MSPNLGIEGPTGKKSQTVAGIVLVSPAMLLKDCSGFHPKAAAHWDDFKYGLENVREVVNADSDDSCYICFDPTQTSSSLAIRTVRARQFVPVDAELSCRSASSFAVYFDEKLMLAPPSIVDIIGGFLFRDARDFLVIPPIRDHIDLIREAAHAISGVVVPDVPVVRKAFGSDDEGSKSFRTVLGLTLVRDVLQIYALDGREVPSEVIDAIRLMGGSSDCWTVLSAENELTVDSLNATLRSVKPTADRSLMDEWESTVVQMYNRPPPPRKRATSVTPAAKRKSLRTRKPGKRFTEEEDESDKEEEHERVVVVEDWLQCDNCSKWRLVTADQLKAFEDKFFECSEVGKDCEKDASDELDQK